MKVFAGQNGRGDGRPACRLGSVTGGPPSTGLCLTALLLLLVLGAAQAAAPEKPDPPASFEGVQDRLPRGSDPKTVRDLLGPPRRVARQILSHRHLEQWLYDQPCPLRVTFDCPRGRKPQVVNVRRLSGPGR